MKLAYTQQESEISQKCKVMHNAILLGGQLGFSRRASPSTTFTHNTQPNSYLMLQGARNSAIKAYMSELGKLLIHLFRLNRLEIVA